MAAGDALFRLARHLRASAGRWGEVESQYPPNLSRVGGAASEGEGGVASFRLAVTDPPVGEREYIVTVTESNRVALTIGQR